MRRSASVVVLVALTLTVIAGSRQAVQGIGQESPGQTLGRAMDEYEKARYRSSEAACDNVIVSLQALPSLDALQSTLLLTAHELRARVRFQQRNTQGAREDFRALLIRVPSHTYGTVTTRVGGVNPDSQTLFEEVRKETVGSIVLNLTPPDVEVTLDGEVVPPAVRAAGQPILVVAGPHAVSAQKPGHSTREETLTVAAGTPVTVDWVLERLTSKIEVITSPPGVEVYLDGELKGKTPPGPPPAKYSADVDVTALGPTASGVLTIPEVRKGSRRFEFKLDCHLPAEQTQNYEQAGDFYLVKKLTESSSPLRIEGAEGRVFIDGVQKGLVPYTERLCPKPEPQVIEIRTDRGRHIQRVTPVPGGPITIQARPRPAIAVLSQVGLPAGFRDDLRLELETAFASSERVMFFRPNAELVQKEMSGLGLAPGWLSLKQTGQALSMMSPSTRLNISNRLARSLEVQGVAEIHVPAPQREPRSILLTYLAAGSSIPETIAIKLDDLQGSVRNAVAMLNSSYAMARVSAGVEVADVTGVSGAVVLRQVWDLTGGIALKAGDVIETVDGRKVEDGTAFEGAIASRKPGDKVQLQVRGQDGQTKPVTLAPATFSLVVNYEDETLPVNRLLLDFRNRVLDAPTPRDQSIARLNLAVVLMRAGNWGEAKAELDKVDLPDLQQQGGQAVSRGTAQYYLGMCLESLDRRPEAQKAYQAAAASPGALLTGDDNTLVKPLAEEKLRLLRR